MFVLREKYCSVVHPEARATVWQALSSSQQAGAVVEGRGLYPCSVGKLITTNSG